MSLWIARDPDGLLRVCNSKMKFNVRSQKWEHPVFPFGTLAISCDVPGVTFDNSPLQVNIVLPE